MKFGLGVLLLIAALSSTRAAEASTYRWQVDASGSWNNPANWTVVEGAAGAGYPNLAGDVAVFDEPLTAARTVTIPDTVTISIGRLTVELPTAPGTLTIAGAGTGVLIFDNLGEDAVIESTGTGAPTVLSTPIQLAADVVVNGRFQSSGGVSETGGARNVTVTGGLLTYIGGFIPFAGNTYTGTTTVTNGGLSVQGTSAPVPLVRTLIVGDGAGAAGSASVALVGDSVENSAAVLVRADGSITAGIDNSLTASPRIGALTVEGGRVAVGGNLSSLLVQGPLTMEGGDITIGNTLVLLGAVNATSTAAGPAVIRSAGPDSAALRLGPGNHDFTIADGSQAIDLRIDVDTIQGLVTPAGMNKLGAGVMQMGGGSYTGGTTINAGELIVNGNVPASQFVVATSGVLSGTGTVGLLAPSGTVAPGNPVGVLNSSSVAFGPAHFAVGIASGGSYGRLNVTGTVSLGGPTLDLTSAFLLPPTGVFRIIENDGNDAVSGTFAGLPEGSLVTVAPGGPVFTISYQGGDGNDVTLTNATAVNYFLSEGATGSFFDEDVLIANPNTVAAPVSMTFFLPDGGVKVHNITVPAQSRATVEVDEIEGLENVSTSVEVHSENRLTLAVERTMFWDAAHYGGHTANAVPRAERQWFFAEGAQNNFFNTYLLLANPDAAMTATVTFLRENEPPFVLEVDLPAASRTTVDAGTHPELVGRSFGIMVDAPSPITAERAMYFASTPGRLWSGGHDNVGSSAPSTSWFHPEGASGTFFTTFILMSNPQTSPATVTLRFLLQDGNPIELTKTIPAQGRLTVNPAAEGLAPLENASFSTVVTSNVPIVSERAMYWNTDDTSFGEGHASSGLTDTAREWLLAEGRVGGPNAYATYILLANPQSVDAEIKVTFLRETGTAVVKNYTVPANTRFNIDVGGMVSELQNESFGALIEVTNDAPIAVERSMYWNVEGRFWSGGTNAVGAIVPR